MKRDVEPFLKQLMVELLTLHLKTCSLFTLFTTPVVELFLGLNMRLILKLSELACFEFRPEEP